MLLLGIGVPKLKLVTSLDNWRLSAGNTSRSDDFAMDEFGNLEQVAILIKSENVLSRQSLERMRSLCVNLIDSVNQIESLSSLINYRVVDARNPFKNS